MPNGMTRNWNNPSGVTIAVRSRDAFCTGTYQYPRARSRAVMYLALPRESIKLSTRGIGYTSASDMAFSRL